jgi:formylglycine-generating enzyme
MNDETAFLQAMQEHPDDTALRLVFADWLEERGDSRGELIRLLHTLTQSVEVPDRRKLEDRLRNLLASGVKPVGPFWTNSIGMKFAWIPAGTFLMGSPANEEERDESEIQHKVTLTKGHYLAIHPVTQACWREVMGNNPSRTKGDDLPVEMVSWEGCKAYLRKLSGRDGHAYRLPTEAEWEYGCRGGTTTPFSFGETISTDQANYNGNYPYGNAEKGLNRGKTTPVGTFPPNAWGLHDMHGNVWEWCQDWYGDYSPGEAVDPEGPQQEQHRVLRGGSFVYVAREVRSATRSGDQPTICYSYVGFRVARACP